MFTSHKQRTKHRFLLAPKQNIVYYVIYLYRFAQRNKRKWEKYNPNG
jgi:hypothetical protein